MPRDKIVLNEKLYHVYEDGSFLELKAPEGRKESNNLLLHMPWSRKYIKKDTSSITVAENFVHLHQHLCHHLPLINWSINLKRNMP